MKEKLEGSVAWVWKFWGRPEDVGQRKNRRKEGSGELSEWALSVSIAVREVGRGDGRKCERKLCRDETREVGKGNNTLPLSSLGESGDKGPGDKEETKVGEALST